MEERLCPCQAKGCPSLWPSGGNYGTRSSHTRDVGETPESASVSPAYWNLISICSTTGVGSPSPPLRVLTVEGSPHSERLPAIAAHRAMMGGFEGWKLPRRNGNLISKFPADAATTPMSMGVNREEIPPPCRIVTL